MCIRDRLCLARRFILEVAERAIERVQAMRHSRIDHARDGVMPEVLLEECAALLAFLLACFRVGENAVARMAATDPRRLHAA